MLAFDAVVQYKKCIVFNFFNFLTSLTPFNFQFHIVFAVVFAALWQLVAHEAGQELAQLEVEPLAGEVAVGVDVELS